MRTSLRPSIQPSFTPRSEEAAKAREALTDLAANFHDSATIPVVRVMAKIFAVVAAPVYLGKAAYHGALALFAQRTSPSEAGAQTLLNPDK